MKNETRHLFLTVVLLMAALAAVAAPRTLSQARAIAQRQALSLGVPMSKDGVKHRQSVARRLSPRSGAAESAAERYYVFDNGGGHGFTIVSGDDRLPDIVAYSAHGSIDETNLPDGFVCYMQAYDEFAAAVERGDKHALSTLSEVQALRASGYSQTAVAPLLGDIQWNQGDPYNRLAPRYDGENLSVTGCVATAMAQVMMYHRWPDVLKADIPAYQTNSRGLYVSGSAAGEALDWDSMLPRYVDGQYDYTQADAVAKLMSLCGKAIKMDYGPESGASVSASDLVRFFGYDKETTTGLSRASFSLAEWVAIIDSELAAARPMLYSGASSTSAHQFVCDGADGNGLYHINWGWGGYQDGYFDLTVLNPDKGGIGSGDAPDGFNRGCAMIIGMQPDNGIVDQPLVTLPDMCVGNWSDDQGFTFSATRDNAQAMFTCRAYLVFGNISSRDISNARVAFGVKNADGSYTPISPTQTVSIQQPVNGVVYGVYYDKTFSYAFPVGRTAVYGIYSLNRGITWKPCRQDYPVVELEATATELKRATTLSATLSADGVYSGVASQFTIALTNTGDVDYLGLLDAYVSTTGTKPAAPSANLYVTVPAHSTVSRTFDLTCTGSDAYVWVDTDAKYGAQTLVGGAHFCVRRLGRPNIVLRSVETNATASDFESANAFYGSYRVYLPRVNDDKVKLRYNVANNGEDYYGRFYFRALNGSDYSQATAETWNVFVSGGGAVTSFDVEVPYGVMRSNTVVTDFYFLDDNYQMALEESQHSYPIVNDDGHFTGYYFPVNQNSNWFYLTGVPSAVSAPEASAGTLRVEVGTGQLVLTADSAQTVTVVNLAGQRVATPTLSAGVPVTIALPSGIYIVGGRKVSVR